jgi:hypothetical protein
MGIHFYCPDTGPGNLGDPWLCNYGLHCLHDKLTVCPTIQQGSRDHVTCRAVERIKNKDMHLQYL